MVITVIIMCEFLQLHVHQNVSMESALIEIPARVIRAGLDPLVTNNSRESLVRPTDASVYDNVCYDASHYRSAREYSKHWIDRGSGDRSNSVHCSFYCGCDNHNQQIQTTQEEKRRVSQSIKSIVILCNDTIY